MGKLPLDPESLCLSVGGPARTNYTMGVLLSLADDSDSLERNTSMSQTSTWGWVVWVSFQKNSQHYIDVYDLKR